MSVKVGLVDSGIDPQAKVRLAEGCAFVRDDRRHITRRPPIPDPIGHGTRIATLIAEQASDAELTNAQVFLDREPIDAGILAAAIDWCVECDSRVINLSLGLNRDRATLRHACARALAAGITLVSATPARGARTFPASYPDVLSVSGDARCAPGTWSLIEDLSFIGASPRPPQGDTGGGASCAAATLSGIAAAFFLRSPGARQADLLAHLQAGAAFVGREHRTR